MNILTNIVGKLFGKKTAKKVSRFMFGGGNAIAMTIYNDNPSIAQTWSVFGTNFSGAQPPGVQVGVEPGSLDELARESIGSGFLIKKLKISSTDPDQLKNSIVIESRSITGSGETHQFNPMNYQSPMAGNNTLIEIGDVNIPVTNDMNISGTINPLATMTLIMTVEERKQSLYKKSRYKPAFSIKPGSLISGIPVGRTIVTN